MIEKVVMAKNPNKDLYAHFVINARAEDADGTLVEFTAHEMRQRLREQREKGFSGWNTPQCTNDNLMHRLVKNLEKGDLIDVINLAAMLLARQQLFEEIPLAQRG